MNTEDGSLTLSGERRRWVMVSPTELGNIINYTEVLKKTMLDTNGGPKRRKNPLGGCSAQHQDVMGGAGAPNEKSVAEFATLRFLRSKNTCGGRGSLQ